jgi:hypothetical protein
MMKEEQALLIFEMKIFRRIYGAKYEDGEWISRTNRELEEMSRGENIIKWIMGQRISWLGHLERMEEGRMPKKIFTQELEGTKRRGRPRKGWREVERDLQVLGVRRWSELVKDRTKWRDIVRKAKAHNGLQCQWKKKKMCVGKQATHSQFTQQISIGGAECTLSCGHCSYFAVHRSFVEYLLNDIFTVVIVHT